MSSATTITPTITTTTTTTTTKTSFSPLSSRLQMITQTYSLAHMARRKLAREASRSDLNLSRLVGHANLLDSLMLELGRAEREQHQEQHPISVQRRSKSDTSRHIQWAGCVVVEPEEDWNTSDAESDNEGEEECELEEYPDMEANMVSLQRVPSHRNLSNMNTPNIITYPSPISYPDVDDDDEDFDVLQLEYSPSHSSPPELDHDSDSSEDETMPPSPPTIHLPSFLSTNPSIQNLSKPTNPENLSAEPLTFEKVYITPPNTHSELIPTISVF